MTTPLRDPETTGVLIAALLERASDQRIEVVRLTDEELSVLDGPDANQVAPFPWLSTLSPEQRETAEQVAARGLVVRGLAAVSAVNELSDEMVLGVEDDVYAVLAARRASSAIVLAERRAPADDRTRVIYVEVEQGVVDEDVTPGGLHTFGAGPSELAIDALCAFVDPRGVAQEDGPEKTFEIDTADTALEGLLPVDEAEWVSVVTAVVPGTIEPQTNRLAVVALPTSVRVCVPALDRPEASIRAVSATTLRALLAGLLSTRGTV